MSLQTRLSALITAVGTDIKELKARTPTILRGSGGGFGVFLETEEPTYAVEWRISGSGGALLAKLIALNPGTSVIGNETELWAKVKSRNGVNTRQRLIVDTLGNSDLAPNIVTSLPTTDSAGAALYDGQECYLLADATNGVVWHLKYKTSTTKWHYVGGPPIFQEVATAEGPSVAGGFANLATVGPSITVPAAGDYDLEIGFSGYAAGAGNALRMSYAIGATLASTNDQALFETVSATAYTEQVSRPRRKTLAAGAALVAKYMVTVNTGGPTFQYRWMRLTPVRLG